jgi:hypothetical protein
MLHSKNGFHNNSGFSLDATQTRKNNKLMADCSLSIEQYGHKPNQDRQYQLYSRLA